MQITPSEFFGPATRDEIWRLFDENPSFGKHYPLLYSIVRGTKARRAVEIGIGKTTAVIRAALEECGGVLYSCDADVKRFSNLLDSQTDSWRLFLGDSTAFIESTPAPFDVVCHDGAHDYKQVKRDLEGIVPKMRKFGLICVHDTQASHLVEGMLLAIDEIAREFPITYTHLPYACGLALIRVEDSPHAPLPAPDATTKPMTLYGARDVKRMKIYATLESKRIWLSNTARTLGLSETRLYRALRAWRRPNARGPQGRPARNDQP